MFDAFFMKTAEDSVRSSVIYIGTFSPLICMVLKYKVAVSCFYIDPVWRSNFNFVNTGPKDCNQLHIHKWNSGPLRVIVKGFLCTRLSAGV